MRTSRVTTTVLAALAVPALWAATVTLPAAAAADSSGRVPAAAWACRSGSTPVTPNLNSSGTVCGRLDGRAWRGHATVTLTARGAAVTGTLALAPDHLPAVAGGGVTNVPFTVRAGRSVTLTVDGSTTVDPGDTGLVWSASPYVSPAPGSGLLWQSWLSSPVITRTPRTVQNTTDTAVTAWACSAVQLDGVQAAGQGTLCVRRSAGYVESSGTLTYTTTLDGSLTTGVAIDGHRAAEAAPILRNSQGRSRTITLPVTRSRVLTRDDTASSYLSVVVRGTQPITTQRSDTIAVN